MRDYYVSATVRMKDEYLWSKCGGAVAWHLWTVRIKATCLSDARAHAILMIDKMDRIYGELQVMWDEAEAIIAPEWNQPANTL